MGKVLMINMEMIEVANPLSDIERRKFQAELFKWKEIICDGDLEAAKIFIHPEKKYINNFAEKDLHFLYYIFLARYYLAVGNKEDFEKTIEYLDTRQPEFNNMQNHYYFQVIATNALSALGYKKALDAFFKAEEYGLPEWADISFYYNFGRCLSDMNYTRKAIECLNKAQEMANCTHDHSFDVYIQTYLALNYCKSGKGDDALEIIKKCCLLEKAKGSTSAYIGFVYTIAGEIYYRLNMYEEALKIFDEAFEYDRPGSSQYIQCVYYKSLVLIAVGRRDESIVCLEQGLTALSVEEPTGLVELQTALLEGLMHSQSLSDDKSIEYIKTVVNPQLIKYEQYVEAINYYVLIRDFYGKAGNSKGVLECSRLIEDVYKKGWRSCV